MTSLPKHWSETESPLDDFVFLVKSLTGPICIFGTLGSIVFLLATDKINLKHAGIIESMAGSGLLGGSVVTALTRGRKSSSLLEVAETVMNGLPSKQDQGMPDPKPGPAIDPNFSRSQPNSLPKYGNYDFPNDAVIGPVKNRPIEESPELLHILDKPTSKMPKPHDEAYYENMFLNK